MPELKIEARIENLDQVLTFIEKNLEAWDCSMKAQMQIAIAVEEIFVNIAHYAYAPAVGTVRIRLENPDNVDMVQITFTDKGIPYDPLAKEDPDVTLSAEERQIGGIGIYMVKKSMDAMFYEYKDKQNILQIRKKIK